jgi:hypothetical protein
MCTVTAVAVAILVTLAACTAAPARRDPVQHARPVPITVKKEVWPAIVKTLVLQGEVIGAAQPDVSRVKFVRRLTEDTLSKLCDTRDLSGVGSFRAGVIELSVWLEDGAADSTNADLKAEGRCQAAFEPPKWTWLFGPWPLQFPALIITKGKLYETRRAELPSSGELERELQAQVLTTLGLELPDWLKTR